MKTAILYVILLGCSVFSPVVLALDSGDVATYARQTNDPDPAIRLTAMKNLLDQLARLGDGAPGGAGNDVIPILTKGLSDPVVAIRAGAASGLFIISMGLNNRFIKPNAAYPDPQSFPPLKAALEKAMFDPDRDVRERAMGAYVLMYDLNSQLQARLIQQSAMEEKASAGPVIIDVLANCSSPSPATQAFLTRLLDDEKTRPFVVQSFANIPSSMNLPPPPMAALPKLADLLAKEKDTGERQMLVRAVGKYGAQALPYLSEIEHLRDAESDPTTRRNLQAAADAIRAGKPLEH